MPVELVITTVKVWGLLIVMLAGGLSKATSICGISADSASVVGTTVGEGEGVPVGVIVGVGVGVAVGVG